MDPIKNMFSVLVIAAFVQNMLSENCQYGTNVLWDCSSEQAVPNSYDCYVCTDRNLNSVPSGIKSSTYVLDLRRNLLSSLSRGSFINLGSLQVIVLSDNKLTSVPYDLFGNILQLKQIYLDGNEIEALPEDLFKQISSLTLLDISRNKITALTTRMFARNGQLQQIFLSKNQFESIPADIFNVNNLNLVLIECVECFDCSCTPAGVSDWLTTTVFDGHTAYNFSCTDGVTINADTIVVTCPDLSLTLYPSTHPSRDATCLCPESASVDRIDPDRRDETREDRPQENAVSITTDALSTTINPNQYTSFYTTISQSDESTSGTQNTNTESVDIESSLEIKSTVKESIYAHSTVETHSTVTEPTLFQPSVGAQSTVIEANGSQSSVGPQSTATESIGSQSSVGTQSTVTESINSQSSVRAQSTVAELIDTQSNVATESTITEGVDMYSTVIYTTQSTEPVYTSFDTGSTITSENSIKTEGEQTTSSGILATTVMAFIGTVVGATTICMILKQIEMAKILASAAEGTATTEDACLFIEEEFDVIRYLEANKSAFEDAFNIPPTKHFF